MATADEDTRRRYGDLVLGLCAEMAVPDDCASAEAGHVLGARRLRRLLSAALPFIPLPQIAEAFSGESRQRGGSV